MIKSEKRDGGGQFQSRQDLASPPRSRARTRSVPDHLKKGGGGGGGAALLVAPLRVRARRLDWSNKSIALQSVPKEFQKRPTTDRPTDRRTGGGAAAEQPLEQSLKLGWAAAGGDDGDRQQQLWAAVDERPRRGGGVLCSKQTSISERE